MGMDIIYVDELFVRNALLDYLLLLSAARLRGAPIRRGRFALAAGLGGIYAVLAAIPPLSWLAGVPWALGVSVGMGLAAYGGGPGFWERWGTFLALAALFAGAVAALGRLVGEGATVSAASGRVRLLCFGLGYAAVHFVLSRPGRRRQVVEAEIVLGERRVRLAALRDTGNELFDPVTGAAVMVADPEALAPLFDPPLSLPLPADAAACFRRLSEHKTLRGRLRLVSYASVGTEHGLLVCFRPDSLRADGEELCRLAAFSPTPLSGRGYRAVL